MDTDDHNELELLPKDRMGHDQEYLKSKEFIKMRIYFIFPMMSRQWLQIGLDKGTAIKVSVHMQIQI